MLCCMYGTCADWDGSEIGQLRFSAEMFEIKQTSVGSKTPLRQFKYNSLQGETE